MRTILSCVLVLGSFICLGSELVAKPLEMPETDIVKRALKGRTKKEVKAILGNTPPQKKEDLDDGVFCWTFHVKAYDPASKETMQTLVIHFNADKKCSKCVFSKDDPL